MALRSRAPQLLLISAAAVLAACGGGGGGSDSSSSGSIDFTEANALDVAQEVYATGELDEGFTGSLGGGFIGAAAAGSDAPLSAIGTVLSLVAPDVFPPQGISASATESVSCDGGGSVTISANDALTEIAAEFFSCFGFGGEAILQSTRINGGLEIDLPAGFTNVDPKNTDIRLAFKDLVLDFGSGESFTIDGDYRELARDLTGSGELLHQQIEILIDELEVRFDSGDTTRLRRLSGFDLQKEERYTISGDNIFQLSLNGTLEIPRFGGTVNFETTTPLVAESGNFSDGTLRISGIDAEVMFARFRSGGVILLVDTDGLEDENGEKSIDYSEVVAWPEFINFDSIY